MSGAQAFDGFYDSVRKSREYHTRNWVEERPLRSEVAVSAEPAVAFSGDEVFGKYLDLHAAHQAYCNLPSLPSRDVDYLQYLEKFNAFFYLPAACRATKAYGTYVEELWDYLRGFFQRTQPLVDVDPLVAEWRTKFLEEWSAGSVNGWSSSTSSRRREEGSAPQPLRLGMFNELSELEALGAERLKDALEAMGLKCGGTLRERAERLWSVRGKRPDEYPAKLRVKATATNGGDDSRQQVRNQLATALLPQRPWSHLLCGRSPGRSAASRR
jgi:splicing factor 3A subunit 3